MRVLKFGGSSLATPGTIRGVGRILLEARRREPIIGVVSAFQGVTNQLLECARLAEKGEIRERRFRPREDYEGRVARQGLPRPHEHQFDRRLGAQRIEIVEIGDARQQGNRDFNPPTLTASA